MEGRVAGDVELDSAVFQVTLTKNRYEAIACNGESAESVASGPFDQLVLHLEDAKNFQSRSSSGSFKLLLIGDAKGSTWFTKSTLERFLHIINSPDASKTANGILQEMSQLEETRKFHDYLQSKEQQNLMGGALTGGLSSTTGKPQQGNIGPNSSVATKNELLRALDLRLSALKEEILVLLSRAVGSKLLNKEVSDLSGFVQHFGTSEFSWLMRCLLLIRDCQPSVLPPHQASTAERKDDALETRDINSQANIQRPITSNVSPAKLAQVERKISMESDDSSESTDEDEAVVERSRPLMRSASPRRSASPMRRVQIGRSGSRRSTPIAIKSLSYFPPSQRVALDKDDESSCNGETDQPPRRSDNNVRRMSVQDAISLFEKKQKGENLDSESKKAGLVATKSVLRRWSSGMGDSLNSNTSEEKTSDCASQSKSNNMASDAEKNEAELQAETDAAPNIVVAPEAGSYDADGHGITVSEMENVVSSHTNISAEQTHSGQESNSDRAVASAEWNRQKEAELNQMLMKMMEVMPGKFAGANVTATGLISASEKKGGLQREKRDTKVRTEKGVKRPAKETSTKLLRESVGQNRAAVTPKTSITTEKRNSPIPQRARRNSSPPVLPKEVISKTPAKKSSPKPSPAPATRSSWSGSLTKATSSTAQKTKNSPGAVSTSTPTSRRRTATASLAPQPISKVEKPLQAVKNKKEPVTATKPAIKGQEDKKTRTAATKPSRVAKSSPASEEKSSAVTKSGMYNKVPKKSSVVPVESKPVKKATGISQGVGSGAVKSKVPQLGDSSKGSGIVTRAEDKEQSPVTTEPTTKKTRARV
ncbi:COP1-interacting protein 7-like isoform X3 [Triticum dicoccoides]|uniref:COP1-interacting protein 7-like isoform X3 n=1 Tax=Triticum dicoccoides TaxID=85692 RepID=UPI00188E34CB|nr:COP1-interacting protein 7-like isoform X3 [Triticum dicoccoides]